MPAVRRILSSRPCTRIGRGKAKGKVRKRCSRLSAHMGRDVHRESITVESDSPVAHEPAEAQPMQDDKSSSSEEVLDSISERERFLPDALSITDLYVQYVPWDLAAEDLRLIFALYADVVSARVLNQSGNNAMVPAIVTVSSRDEADWIVRYMHKNIPDGLQHPVDIKMCNNDCKRTKI